MGDTVFLVQGECGDYYCDGQHNIGAYSTREKADEAAQAALELTFTDYDSKLWMAATVVEVELDAAPAAWSIEGGDRP